MDSIDAQTRTGRDIHGVNWDNIPQFKGISRVADNSQCLMLTFNFTPSDQQMRRLYEELLGWLIDPAEAAPLECGCASADDCCRNAKRGFTLDMSLGPLGRHRLMTVEEKAKYPQWTAD